MISRKTKIILSFLAAAVLFTVLLNVPVASMRGVNYRVTAIKMPLYIKIIEFFDRDYQYRQLVRSLLARFAGDEERALALFDWTHRNIRKVPAGFPVVDDHVQNIIIRGYGASDQCEDVFATLCNYAGYRARFTTITSAGQRSKVCLTVVRLKSLWYVFDTYNGVYFRNKSGALASTQDILAGDWVAQSDQATDMDYAIYFKNISLANMDKLARSNIQLPLRRFAYEISKCPLFRFRKARK